MCLDLETLQRGELASNLLLVLVKRLETAQKRLSDYKASSGLNSSSVVALSSNIDQLRAQQTQLLVQEQWLCTRLKIICQFEPISSG